MERKLATLLILGLALLTACQSIDKNPSRLGHKYFFNETQRISVRDDGYTLNVPEGWIYIDGQTRPGPEGSCWMHFTRDEQGNLIPLNTLPVYDGVW